MKVTIITPTFNSAKTLIHNLNSVARQSYKNIEHIIVDNCSTDGTQALAGGFSHISRIISENDKGIYDAMNKGIANATGDIIGILNSDDYLASEHTIANIVSEFTASNADAIYGNLIYVSNKNPEKIQRVWVAGGYDPKLFYTGWMLPHPTFYVKKEVYEKYGNYNDSFRYAADYEMILRLLLKERITISPMREVIVYMLAGGAGNKDLNTRVKVNLEDRRAWETVGLTPKWYTLYAKPLRKIWQYALHYFSVKWLVHIPPAHDNSSFIYENTNQVAKVIEINSEKF
jgi:glycosyltransferase involved in cell wall biosynthesis